MFIFLVILILTDRAQCGNNDPIEFNIARNDFEFRGDTTPIQTFTGLDYGDVTKCLGQCALISTVCKAVNVNTEKKICRLFDAVIEHKNNKDTMKCSKGWAYYGVHNMEIEEEKKTIDEKHNGTEKTSTSTTNSPTEEATEPKVKATESTEEESIFCDHPFACYYMAKGLDGQSEICYGFSGKQPAKFLFPKSGKVIGYKLIHSNGSRVCQQGTTSTTSKWGCEGRIESIITDEENEIEDYSTTGDTNFLELYFRWQFSWNKAPYKRSGDEGRVWSKLDLMNDNIKDLKESDGKHCIYVMVYAMVF